MGIGLPKIKDILNDEDLEALTRGAPKTPEAGELLVRAYPPARSFVEAIGSARANQPAHEVLDDREHEIAVLSVLVANDGAAALLAVHLYFALAFGIAPMRVANTLLVAGGYAGMPRYVHAMATLERTLLELKALITAGKTRADQILPVLLAPVFVG